MAYRPSAAGNKSVSVKDAIQLFEKNATVSTSTEKSLVVSEDRRNVAVNCSTGEYKQTVENADAKKEPKYDRVIFKRDATLVCVTLDCEEVCNEDNTSQKANTSANIQCQQQTAKFLPNSCEEESDKFHEKNDKDLKNYIIQAKSDQNCTVVAVEQGSGRSETEHNRTTTKPTVPNQKVTKEQIHTNVPFSKNQINDSNCVKETCKPGSICDTARNASMAENTSVRHDNLACPQNSSAILESSVKRLRTTEESDDPQKGNKDSVAPKKSFFLGASVPGTDQLTGTSSNHPYSVVQPQDDDVYDDVGPPINEEEQWSAEFQAAVRLMTAHGRAILGSTSMRRGASSSASSSIGNHSCCDQSNSLYSVGDSRFYSASVYRDSTDARSQRADLSGGGSPLTTGSPENSRVERRFADEPLYQFYTAAVVEREMRSEIDSDGYEDTVDGSRMPKSSRPTAMEMIQPRKGQHHTLWCEIPEVVSSGILSTISPHQKKLQEAKFEIIISEASYFKSLNVLEKHFMSSLEMYDESVLSKNDRRTLFYNLIPVKTCSEHFLAELEECWQDNILLNGICEVVYRHASNNFSSYVKYCSNQICLARTLHGLKEQNMKFSEVLLQLESNPICQSLSLHSFLMLPMQRITRLPLLIDAVLTRLDQTDDEYTTCQLALATLTKIVRNCNEDAQKMERVEEILILSRQLYFPSEVKAVPIISSARWLVRRGELTHLVERGDECILLFGKKFSRIQIHMFLFTDLLVITKKKRKFAPDATGDECYAIIDYCPRNLVHMTSTEGMTSLPDKFMCNGSNNLVLLTMLQNHEKRTVEMVLTCSTESDQQRWLEAVSAPVSDNPNETVYEKWDCPQVMAIHPYVACQPDELSLGVADVVNVLRKMSDGWYQGERIRDCERGWFPGNYTSEVASAHARARNLKQRYRLLALSGKFLENQHKENQVM